MGDVAEGFNDALQDPKSFVSTDAALGSFFGPIGTAAGASMDAQKRAADEQKREDDAAAAAKAEAEAKAKAEADAKAKTDAEAQENARKLAELRLARRMRSMTTESDNPDAARLRLG